MQDDTPKFPYEKGCYALLLGIGLVTLAAWRQDKHEAMCALLMGLFFLWQVVRGLIIKRYFWRIADEKVSFWSLLVALFIAAAFLQLCTWQN